MLRSLKAFTFILIFTQNPAPDSDFGINNVRVALQLVHFQEDIVTIVAIVHPQCMCSLHTSGTNHVLLHTQKVSKEICHVQYLHAVSFVAGELLWTVSAHVHSVACHPGHVSSQGKDHCTNHSALLLVLVHCCCYDFVTYSFWMPETTTMYYY